MKRFSSGLRWRNETLESFVCLSAQWTQQQSLRTTVACLNSQLLSGYYTCIFGMCYFSLPLIFAFTIYYNRFGSVTLFGFKLRETLNIAVVFLRYLLRPAPDPTVARAFPRALQGHLPRLQ